MAVAVDLEDALADGLAALLPGPVQVERMQRLTGGASRETWSFDAVDAEGTRHALILRRDFPERAAEPAPLVAELDRASELELQRALHAAGVPVPRPGRAPAGRRYCYARQRGEAERR